jgi:hypothetical protein
MLDPKEKKQALRLSVESTGPGDILGSGDISGDVKLFLDNFRWAAKQKN